MTIIEQLTNVVLRRLPRSGRLIWERMPRCEYYANRISWADTDDAHAFGESKDAQTIKELEKSLSRTAFKIQELGLTSKRYLSSNLGVFSQSDEELGDFEALIDFMVKLKLARTAVKIMRAQSKFQNTPSLKPNWRAMSVAKVCREIWAEEEWTSNEKKYGPEPLNEMLVWSRPDDERVLWKKWRAIYDDHIENFAPRYQKHNSPGAFGRFLEEIFETLGILAKDGAAVTAATALDALRNQKRQEKKQSF